MEVKRNLVKELRDEKFRSEYLHPKKRSFFELYKIMSADIYTDKRISIYYLIFGLSNGILAIMGAFIVELIVRIIKSMEMGDITVVELSPLLITIGVYASLFFVLSSLSKYLSSKIKPFIYQLRNEKLLQLFKKFAVMEYGLYEDSSFISGLGDWSRAIQSNVSGYQGILEKVLDLFGEFFAAALLGILLFMLDYKIVLIAIISTYVSIYLETRYTKYQKSMLKEDRDISKKIQRLGSINSDFQYGKDVRVFRMENALQNLLGELIVSKDQLLEKYFKKRLIQSPIVAMASTLTFVLGLYFLGNSYLNQGVDIERFLMLITALLLFVLSVGNINKYISYIQSEAIYLDDFYDLLDAKLEPQGGDTFPKGINYDIRFENIWFKYPGSENWVLKDTSFYVPQGSSIALVGVNGAGKTSIIKLLIGLYQPDRGTIYVGGVDISTISQSELAKIYGVVFQDINPIALTIAENVASSTDVIDRERVRSVLKRVGLLDKIENYPKGIDSPLLKVLEDDGIVLSGGENQKLMIARALYKKSAEILILDEPTASLDALAEEEIYKEFNGILRGRTAIFISHRLASTRFCDKIVLLNGGYVTEEGTHEELLENGSLYYEMYETQASYYQEDYNGEQ